MKNYVLVALLGLKLAAQGTEVAIPCYRGGFQCEGSWIYLRPTATDADLEYGSFITLTTPPNLNALLLEVDPPHRSGYELSLRYVFSNSNQSLVASYFSLHASDKDSKSITAIDQLIQNFLGASYSIANARADQRIDQANLAYRFESVIDRALKTQLFAGIAYLSLRRDLGVEYSDLVLNPNPSLLTGTEKSRYWGVGPLIGAEFTFPLLHHFGFTGGLETGVFFGENHSQVSSESFRNNTASSFSSRDTSHPVVTHFNGDLGLVYSQPLGHHWGIECKAGYQIHYYFKPNNRINPFNGYVNNSNTFPVAQSSNLGLGGPYVVLSLTGALCPCSCATKSCCPLWRLPALTFEFTSYWLKPSPTNNDLVFATQSKNLQADPKVTWAGRYRLGYRFCPTADLCFSAFLFDSSDGTDASGGNISSVNASGPSEVVFSAARSRVQYKLDQYDGLLGKSAQLLCRFNLHGGVGLRYLRQNRILTNAYLGGVPPATTREKFPRLKSRYHGVGPLFSVSPAVGPICNFALVGNLGLAFLVGESRATLDQENFGVAGVSSNDLRTPSTHAIAPVFEGAAGIGWKGLCFSRMQIGVEGGYQYLAYYRTVRLLLPTLLTGLEQINSNLILQGPYVRSQIGVSF